MVGKVFIERTRQSIALMIGAGVALGALAAGVAYAGDSAIDTAFAAAELQPGWRRVFVYGGGYADERIVAAARAPDGGYVLAGQRAGGAAGAQIFLAKFKADGSNDTGFGGSTVTGSAGVGRVLKDAYLSAVTDMTIDAQGRIVVVGKTPGALGQSDFGVVRFNADGSDDSSFAGDGGTSVAFDVDAANNRTNDTPSSVVTTPDGAIYVAGVVQDRVDDAPTTVVGAIKLKPDGSLDTAFGSYGTGRTTYCRAQCATVLDVARIVYDAPRNRLLIGGDHGVNASNTDWFIVTQTLSGAVYSSQVSYPIDLGDVGGYQLAYMLDMAVQPTGEAVALGWANDANNHSVPLLLRRQALASSEDVSFGNTAGRGLMVLPTTDAIYGGLAVDSSKRLILAGEYSAYGIVTRLNTDGSVDTHFNGTTSPSAYVAMTSAAQSAYKTVFKRVFLDAGRPVLVGEAPDANTTNADFDLLVTRLQADLIFADAME
ncbi:MAG TPA: hypothetical protein VFN09_02610 [Rhodanobacteraceae bacterium]|nr:hypothetical protein [Rhodanobacteraceae bacterium]